MVTGEYILAGVAGGPVLVPHDVCRRLTSRTPSSWPHVHDLHDCPELLGPNSLALGIWARCRVFYA